MDEKSFALITDVAWLHRVAAGETRITGQNSGLHLACRAGVCGSGRPRTSHELAGSTAGGLSEGFELLGGLCGDAGLLLGGDAISMHPAVSIDGENAPQANGDGGKVQGNSSQQVARAAHVRVLGPEGAVSRYHAVNVEGEEAQSNDWVMSKGEGPANKVNDGDGNSEQAHEGTIEDVRVVPGLRDLDEELPKTLQCVPLLADSLVEHGCSGLRSTPHRSIQGVLESNDMAVA